MTQLAKKIFLVSGCSGYIGSHLCYWLKELDCTVVGIDRVVPGNHESPFIDKFFCFDLTAPLDCWPDIPTGAGIFHCAGLIEGGASYHEPVSYFDHNVVSTRNLLEWAHRKRVSNFIFSSSASVYGNQTAQPIPECATALPINRYGWTKHVAEELISAFGVEFDLSWICLRYFNVAGGMYQLGLGEKHTPETHLIPLAVQAALGKSIGGFRIFGHDFPTGDGTCVRDFVHVMDLVRGHTHAMNHLVNAGSSGRFNLGTGKGYSVLQVVNCVAELVGYDRFFSFSERREGDPPELIAANSKAANILGWSPVESDLNSIVLSSILCEKSRMADA